MRTLLSIEFVNSSFETQQSVNLFLRTTVRFARKYHKRWPQVSFLLFRLNQIAKGLLLPFIPTRLTIQCDRWAWSAKAGANKTRQPSKLDQTNKGRHLCSGDLLFRQSNDLLSEIGQQVRRIPLVNQIKTDI